MKTGLWLKYACTGFLPTALHFLSDSSQVPVTGTGTQLKLCGGGVNLVAELLQYSFKFFFYTF